ncbi:hypothetical protein [Enterococcus diestrammenae]|uniref:hypothetical protein n=1 Tax=Enterococcus diestrammenae TaxID=1155073 RepID=UPI001F9BAEE4|nr:hypothetical protein [Enterococcus diestrammenae]HIX69937.1 hypothetical protein [Candidatus Enterococcus stercoravium]
MKTVIKETLAQKQGKDKVSYFFYAYKGVFIAIIGVLLAVGFIVYSYATKPVTIFNARVITEASKDASLVPALQESYDSLLQPVGKEQVTVEYTNIDDVQSNQVFANQLAAQEFDIIWMEESLVTDFVSRYDTDNVSASDLTFQQDGKTYVGRIMPHAPHPEALAKIKKLYQTEK